MFGKNTTEVSAVHIVSRSTWYLHDITEDVNHHLVKAEFARFLHCKVAVISFAVEASQI